MSFPRFFLPYLRRYRSWIVGAVLSILVFFIASVLLFGLIRPIFVDVLDAEDEVPSILQSDPEAGDGKAGSTNTMDRWVASLNLQVVVDRAFDLVAARVPLPTYALVPLLLWSFFLIRSVAAFANGYLFQKIGLGATNDLRNDLYRTILHQSSRFYSEHPSGELLSRLGNDIQVLQNAVTTRLLDLVQHSITLIVLIWLLLSTHLVFGVITLVVAPLVVVPIVRFGKGMFKTSRHTQERMADLSNLVNEAVRGHRVVKAFGMEKFEERRFHAAADRHLAMKLRAQLIATASSPVVETLIVTGGAALLFYAGRAVASGEVGSAQLVTFLTTLALIQDPVRRLNKVNLALQESLASGQRVQQLMALPNEIEETADARVLNGLGDGIHFDRVSFAYEKETVLDCIDLQVQPSETVALVGRSGAGKSTLVNLVPRFFDPDQGAVKIDGYDLRQVTLASLRGLIGVVTQDTVLFNDTVRNNIAYGRADLSLERVYAAARAAHADDFIRQMPEGYDTLIGESGLKLSGGQRQRLAIARALVKDPPILILDEATSHLDSASEALVQEALENLMRGRTVLVVAHRLSTIQRADRIVVMEQGRIVEQGSHQQLLAAGGAYKELHDLNLLQPVKNRSETREDA